MQQVDPILVSVDEAKRLVSTSHMQMYRWIKDGTVESVKRGRRRLISYQSLQKLAKAEAEA